MQEGAQACIMQQSAQRIIMQQSAQIIYSAYEQQMQGHLPCRGGYVSGFFSHDYAITNIPI